MKNYHQLNNNILIIKKIFFYFLLISFFIVTDAKATSGACSGHDGVNCSAGIDIDGSVICNDGWRKSSVSYFDASECSKQEFYCTQSEYNEIKEKYGIENLLNELSAANKIMTEKNDAFQSYNKNLSGASLIYGSTARQNSLLATEAGNAAEMVIARQENLNNALKYAKEDCLALGKASYYKKITDVFKESEVKQKNILTCPDNSYLNGKMCYCNNGYVVSGGGCVIELKTTSPVNTDYSESKNIVTTPKDLNSLLLNLNENRKESEENKYKKLFDADLKDFKVKMSSDQKNSVTNFIVYGISSSTQTLGSGERRALMRDYLDTVAKEDIYWEDLDNMASGKKIISRNLEKEKQQVNNVLKMFKKIFGHDPIFSNSSEDLAWNTMIYRIRFQRDLNKEAIGINNFKKIFNYTPSTPLDWSAVRVLGYVK